MGQPDRYWQIRKVLILTLLANVVVALIKLIIGILTGTLAMIADAFHSLLDGLSNVIGLIGSAMAARPPDDDHPYGHRRFETLASLMVGGMLLLAAWEIVKSSVQRLFEGGTPEIGPANFIAMLVTLVMNIGVTVYERREGKRLSSEFLLADAQHTRSDVMVSLAVLASLVVVKLGFAWADAVAALIVVVIIGFAAWQVVRNSAGILVDEVALDARQVEEIINSVPGIQSVQRIRSRGPHDEIHVDLDVEIAAPTTTGHSEAIANEMRSRLRERFFGLRDIQVHFVPIVDGPVDYALLARSQADALGLGVHEVIATPTERGVSLEMHIEVERRQSVGEAHRVVSEFEERLKNTSSEIEEVVTHIEPAHDSKDSAANGTGAHRLAHDSLEIARKLHPDKNWHDVNIRAEADGGYAVSMHCHVAPDMPLEVAHDLAEQVEVEVRAALPDVHRVTIHTEPPDYQKR
jgi:cation diffusion facilitator family transporter